MRFKKPYIPEPKEDRVKYSKQQFSPYEERVFRVLNAALRPLTTRQVSLYSGISYVSARSNLDKLLARGVVRRKQLSNRIYWSVENGQ